MVKKHIMVNKLYFLFLKIISKDRFLYLYIIFGFIALLSEKLSYDLLSIIFDETIIIRISSLFIGIILCFILNFYFNFKLLKSEILNSFVYFLIISVFSILVQAMINYFILSKNIADISFRDRILIAGLMFWLGYLLHSKYTFSNRKKIGLAVYPFDETNINSLFKKVFSFPDFIHIDIIDESFNKNEKRNLNYEMIFKIFKIWPNKEMHIHIMSSYPLNYIKKINHKSKNIIFLIHYEIEAKKLFETIEYCKNNSLNYGLAFRKETRIDNEIIKKYDFSYVLKLLIEKPGQSGQKIDINTINNFNQEIRINSYKNTKFIADGGTTYANINFFNTNYIVSSSYIINSNNSIKAILSLTN